MIKIRGNIFLDENLLEYNFSKSGGPGGQHVNKTASAVQLILDIDKTNFPKYMVRRIKKFAGNKLTKDNRLIISARGSRSQYKNRERAKKKLINLLKKAAKKPKRRKKTKPTKASNERRLRKKKHRGRIKKNRKISKRDIDWN